MKKTLVIAEKYLAAVSMAGVLNCTEEKDGYIEGNDYIITWADGHLIGYQYPEEYNPDYKKWKMEDLPLNFDPAASLKVLPGKEQQFDIVKKLIQGPETDKIINAGDAGREGYLIQNRIYKMAGNRKPVKVLWASSLTDEALLEAFLNLHEEEEFENILKEAEARSEMDYILGMNYSRLLSLKCSNDLTLPYGRCMTTLLSLIVSREKEIEEFEPEKTYVIEAVMENGAKFSLIDPEGKELVFETSYEAKSMAEEFKGEELLGTVFEVKDKNEYEKAPLLYSLPDLQSTIGKKYKYTPAKTLQIVQSLYEKYKILSYPRTDSNYLTEDLIHSICSNLECCNFGKFRVAFSRCANDAIEADSTYFNNSKVSDHHALIPVANRNMEHIYLKLSEEERNVFDEIIYSFFGIFSKKRVSRSVTVTLMINNYLFRGSESVEIESGYRLLRKVEIEKEEMSSFFAEAVRGNKAKISQINIKERYKNPPSRYRVGNIIDLMRKYHIGTPATMAATIEKLMDEERPFLVLKDGKYYSTPFGRMYMTVIPEALKNPELTMQMEWKLQQIKDGSMKKEDMIHELYEEFAQNMQLQDFKKMSFSRVEKVKKPNRKNYRKRRNVYET